MMTVAPNPEEAMSRRKRKDAAWHAKKEALRASRQQIKAARLVIAEMFPNCFAPPGSGIKRPLKIGICRDLIDALKIAGSDISATLTRKALHDYTRGPKYSHACAAGGPRYDINGIECGEVTIPQQQLARDRLAEWERRAAGKAEREIAQSMTPGEGTEA